MSKYAKLFKAGSGAQVEETDSSSKNETGYTIMFVDDEESVLKSLRRIFIEEDYNILTALNADEAIKIMEHQKVHLVVSDHRMPGTTGAQLLRDIKNRWPETIRIMLTGYADVQTIMGAVNEGAVYKFITKPWNDEDLRLSVSLALQQYALIQENKKLKELAKSQEKKIKDYSALFDENRGFMGNILVKSGLIKKEQLERAKKEKQGGEFLGETLVRLAMATESKIVKTMQEHLKLERIDLKEAEINPWVAKFLPRELCVENRILPVKVDNQRLTLAMADPSDLFKCDNISLMTGLKVVPVIAGSSDIMSRLKDVYGEKEGKGLSDVDVIADMDPLEEIDLIIEDDEAEVNVQELIGSSEVPPIVRVVNVIISEAIRYKASDIHIEPKTKYTVVRYRVDGMLHSKLKVPLDIHNAVVSRIKILATMDISERRRPQDGRITVKSATKIVDIRVSTMPTIKGEKLVMRILDKNAAVKRLDEVGVAHENLEKIHILIRKPQGIIISTGPTGSGKTTTLYSMMGEIMQSSRNFETIEDPVEYFLEEANQVYIRDDIGLSFASVLRSTLRQDPDVILVGEIRDFETADVTFKAALTGHMVLTSLHTNNSVASITRLIDMGIKQYIIASAIEGILAQRLVRKVCKYCRQPESPDKSLLEMLKVPADSLGDSLYVGKGCERCDNTGYLGRTGIFEVFIMNDDFRHLISGNYREAELLNLARSTGMKTLIEDGMEKVRQGITTLDEVFRVIGTQTGHERMCESCHSKIDAGFLFCPHCGTFRQNSCRKCMMTIEDKWNVCPFCGNNKEVDNK